MVPFMLMSCTMKMLDLAYAKPASKENLFCFSLRESDVESVAVAVCELPVVRINPALAWAFHSTSFTSLTSSALPYWNFGSCAAAVPARSTPRAPIFQPLAMGRMLEFRGARAQVFQSSDLRARGNLQPRLGRL